MNILSGNIKSITTSGELSLVKVAADEIILSAIIIDTPETAAYLKTDQSVKVMFKETEVAIASDEDLKVSLQNRLRGEITQIQRGDLLSKVELHTSCGNITSIITTEAIDELGLTTATRAVAMIKTNEIMLSA